MRPYSAWSPIACGRKKQSDLKTKCKQSSKRQRSRSSPKTPNRDSNPSLNPSLNPSPNLTLVIDDGDTREGEGDDESAEVDTIKS